MNDGGCWIFEVSGEPYPFEELDKYELRRKRDRFTREMLTRYLEHFSLRPFEDEFYAVDLEHPTEDEVAIQTVEEGLSL